MSVVELSMLIASIGVSIAASVGPFSLAFVLLGVHRRELEHRRVLTELENDAEDRRLKARAEARAEPSEFIRLVQGLVEAFGRVGAPLVASWLDGVEVWPGAAASRKGAGAAADTSERLDDLDALQSLVADLSDSDFGLIRERCPDAAELLWQLKTGACSFTRERGRSLSHLLTAQLGPSALADLYGSLENATRMRISYLVSGWGAEGKN